jgi:hypothetical protein
LDRGMNFSSTITSEHVMNLIQLAVQQIQMVFSWR